jgi:hypothetical protein
MRQEVESFTRAFAKAIRLEMEEMRRQLGPFEVPVAGAAPLEAEPPAAAMTDGRQALKRYGVRAFQPNDKLMPGIDCTLRTEAGEELVSVRDVDGLAVVLEAARGLPTLTGAMTLVIYPWFLYERLEAALAALPESGTHFPESSLAVFGKRPSASAEAEPILPHEGLNPAQAAAVRLALGSRVSFIWGPPGTGKTETLSHVVEELAASGRRVLVASTTNAAIDQALAKLAGRAGMAPLFQSGRIVRMGRTDAPTFGAEQREAAALLGAGLRERIAGRERERDAFLRRARAAGTLAERVRTSLAAGQRELFGDPPSADVSASEAAEAVPAEEAAVLPGLPAAARLERLAAAAARWNADAATASAEVSGMRAELAANAAVVVRGAGVILATLSALVVSGQLAPERFDTVVIEEAGMAVLPAVFHCASLARRAVILIGDPRQLPPIVQSADPYARRAMGRGIFDVTVPRPRAAACVALLDVQYRMHPAIGGLVSRLFYDGLLVNGAADRSGIAAARPCPGKPLVLVDAAGCGECRTQPNGYSRFNEGTARLCVEMAQTLVRDGVSSVAVITPYAEQARLIRRGLLERRLETVECRTVHRFQGNERDAVILDTVDGEPFAPGVLLADGREGSTAANLVNVSVSRARGKLIVAADAAYYRRRAPGAPITRLLEEMAAHGEVAPGASIVLHGL